MKYEKKIRRTSPLIVMGPARYLARSPVTSPDLHRRLHKNREFQISPLTGSNGTRFQVPLLARRRRAKILEG